MKMCTRFFVARHSAAVIAIVFFMVLLTPDFGRSASLESRYVGADRCMVCHKKEYDEWKKSGHAQILHKSSDVEIKDIPIPDGYKKENISYVIGGFKWKALFLDMNGYLITDTLSGKGKNQYNLKDKKWVDYLPGEKLPYDCGRCHTTGYSSEGHQDGLAGIIGIWKFDGVQCEACHGPGAVHASSNLKADINVDGNVCSRCHESKPPETIQLRDGFLTPYSEVNQLMKSKMRNFACADCHNPHLSSEHSIKQPCEGCHQKIAAIFKESYKSKMGIKCIDCHMPPAGVIAEGNPALFRGDLKSHLFKIDHTKPFPVVIQNGQKVNPGYLSVDYACIRCHSVYKNREWAARHSVGAHSIQITSNIKIMRFQRVSTSIGFFFAVAALLSALSLKNLLWTSFNKQKMLSIHKHSVWITFSVYVFISFSCVYFHFPLDHPSNALNLGWFIIHVITGAFGIVLYGGKIITVRIYKKGWEYQGVLWGTALFVFWLIQYITVLLHFFNLLEV